MLCPYETIDDREVVLGLVELRASLQE